MPRNHVWRAVALAGEVDVEVDATQEEEAAEVTSHHFED